MLHSEKRQNLTSLVKSERREETRDKKKERGRIKGICQGQRGGNKNVSVIFGLTLFKPKQIIING